MKFILMSDWHLVWDSPTNRLDDVVQTEFRKLKFMLDFADKERILHILQAGDLCDVRRSWQLLFKLSSFMRRLQRERTLYSVMGQHDQYYRSSIEEATIFGVLASSKLLRRLTATPITLIDEHRTSVNLYGASYGESIPEVKTKGLNILVLHKMILAKKFWKSQTEYCYAPEFLRKHPNYSLILCGDAHQKFSFTNSGRRICNTGPLLRLEATEDMMNHQPGFYVYDSSDQSLEWVGIPAEVGKRVLNRKRLEETKEQEDRFESFVNGLMGADRRQSLSFDRNLKLFLHRNKVGAEVRKMLTETKAALEK